MAESVQAAECPATPERVDQCPETPDRLLNMKSPDSSTSSDNECTINLRTRNTNSPPPNCAICLGRCKNKCFTDSCLHQFCFKCLLEWSKVKAECPLCKQPFNSIIHNVKSIDQFEEYLVAQPQQAPPSIPSVPLPMRPLVHHPIDHGLYSRQLDMYLGQYTRYRRSGYSTTVQVHPADNDALQQIFLHRSLLVERLRHEYADGVIPPNMMGELWRRYIYERRLYAMPVVDITGRYRECSARFFRDNPAQMHRIMSWIDRDARVLLRDSEHHATYVLEVIRDILPVFNITSPEFRRRLQTYFGQRTAHFIHELLNFARSPFDMIGYDREVRYSPYYEEVVISSSSSSSGFSDTEDVIHVRGSGASGTRRPGRTEVTIETRSNNSTFIITGTINGSSASGTGSSSMRGDNSLPSSSLPAEIIEVGRAPFENLLQPQILGESQVIQIDRNIVLSSSSSDECEFVSEQKPPHLRTPEQVSLNSESDSDCVFVGESHRTPTIEPAAHTKRKRKPPKGVFISSLSAPSSSNSSSSSSAESDNETVNKREAKSKSKKKKKSKTAESKKPKDTTATSPDNIKTETAQPPAEPTNSELPHPISDCNNSNANDEYNNGASTSSGLPSSNGHNASTNSNTRSQVAVKKYYARPARQASSKRVRNGKSIYEESSCDTDESSTEDKAITRTFKCEKISDETDDTMSETAQKLMRKNRKRKHDRLRRRQSDRRRSTATATSKKKKSKKSSARKKLSSSLVKSSKRRKISTSKMAQQQQQQDRRRRAKARKLSSTKRSSSMSSSSSLSSAASSSSSTTTTSSSSSSTSSGSESANNDDLYSSSS